MKRHLGLVSCLLLLSTLSIATADPCSDADADGVCDADDNCPSVPNPEQESSLIALTPIDDGTDCGGFQVTSGASPILVYSCFPSGVPGETYVVRSGPLFGATAVDLFASDRPLLRLTPDQSKVLYFDDISASSGLLYANPIGGGSLGTIYY